MANVLVRPYAPVGRGLLGEVLGFDPFRNFASGNGSNNLGFDVSRTETGYTVEVPVAGLRPDDITVTVEDRVLAISGKNDRRQFTRSLLIPDEIDPESIEATVEHGLLTLALHVHPKAQPRKIDLKVVS